MLGLAKRKLIYFLLSVSIVLIATNTFSVDFFSSTVANSSPQCGSQLAHVEGPSSSPKRHTLSIYLSCIDNNVRRGIRNGFDRNLVPATINNVIPNTERIVTRGPSSGGNLGFASHNNLLRSPLVAIGYSDVNSSYRYAADACRGLGEFVIGWNSGIHGTPDSPICERIRFTPGNRIGPSTANRTSKSTGLVNQKGLDSPSSFMFYTDPYNANTSALHYFCNAVAPSGGGWGVAISETSLSGTATGIHEQIDNVINQTCRKAKQICNERGGLDCLIVNEDIWRSNIPSNLPQLKTVDLFLTCSNIAEPYHTRSGISRTDVYSELSNLELSAIQDDAEDCSFSIQYFYDVVIAPSHSERVLIRAGLSEDGYVIDDLVGSVTISQAGNPNPSESVTLNPGDRFLVESLDPQNSGQLTKIIANERRHNIVDLPITKAFLDKSRWPREFGEEIDGYRDALREEFLPKSSSVRIEQRSVSGVRVVIAEVDLNNPDTILTLAPAQEVTSTGGLRQFANSRNAAIVLSGTFRDPANTNWTSISSGQTIAGELGMTWPVYTVLGLKRQNQPEMIDKASSIPNWNDYWFAITGTPRLVNGGVPGVTARHPEEEMDINAANGRAAIGFSHQNNVLYHVITIDSISLPKMAEVMSAVGCDDAVNLEGGGGYFIVHDGTVYGPGDVRSPVIVVNDAQFVARLQVQEAWKNF